MQLKVSENRRIRSLKENAQLTQRIKELELELENQLEINRSLKTLPRLSSEGANKLSGGAQKGNNTKELEVLPEQRSNLVDEHMILMSFNQALVKYKSGQSLHSPYFEEWDEKIDLISEVFKRWAKHFEAIAEAGNQSSKAMYELQKVLMEDLITFDFSTEIVNDVYSFADMIKELSSMQESLYESVKSSLLEYIKEFNEKIVMKVKENKKTYNKFFEDYYSLVEKMAHQKKPSSLETLKKKIVDVRKDLELVRIAYLDSLNEVIIHTKVDLIDKVCVWTYSFGSYFRQAASMLERLEPQLHSSTCKVAARTTILKHIKVQLENEKEKCRKDWDNTEEPNLRLKEKEGFVFKQNSKKDWLLRYLIVRDELLFTVKKISKTERYNFNEAHLFCNIFLAKIRRSSEYPDLPVIEIVSVKDNKTYQLFVENNKEAEEWINVLSLKVQHLIENPKLHEMKVQKYHSVDVQNLNCTSLNFEENTMLVNIDNKEEKQKAEQENKINEEVKEIIGANIWADCKTPFPQWFSSNLGVLLCITCSGYHRGLSTDISRVRSLTLDQQTMTTLTFLKSVVSNDINRKVFEAKTSNVDKDRK